PIRPGRLRWIEHPSGTIDGLRMFGPDGRLHPAFVYGASTGRPKPPRACWPRHHGQIVLKFWHSPPALSTPVRIGYLWGSDAPGSIMVSYGATSTALAVRPGLHTAFLPVAGSASTVIVSGFAGNKLCIGDAEAGFARPVMSGQKQP